MAAYSCGFRTRAINTSTELPFHLGLDREPEVSGEAWRAASSNPAILVNDLGSEAGTYIDNQRITGEVLLERGGLLKVGSMLFRLVGQDRDINATTFYNPKQVKAQEKAERKGVKLFLSDKPTAEEAAEVFQAHWNIVRKKAALSKQVGEAIGE